MFRRILLVAAGLFAAACFTCASAIAQSTQSPRPDAPVASAPWPDGCALARVQMLSGTPWVNLKDATHDPTELPAFPAPPDYMADDLADAYKLAPKFFQNQLCGLDGIYIVEHGNSWAFRKIDRDPGKRSKRFLAISADLWSVPSSSAISRPTVPELSSYETGLVRRLARWSESDLKFDKPNPSVASADTPAMTLLAMLAHEYGHILFYETLVAPYGNEPDYNSFCSGNFFKTAWKDLPGGPIFWRSHDDVDGSHFADDISIGQIRSAAPYPAAKGDLLNAFYKASGLPGPQNGRGRWASLLAGFTPDHDFVETFRLFVLMKSKTPLTTLELKVPTLLGMKSADIPASCSARSVLQEKLSCFQQKFCHNSSANACNSNCVPLP